MAKNIFQTLKRCPECCKQIEVTKIKEPHKCHHGKCPSCHDIVDLRNHQCFIKPIGKEEDKGKKKNKKTRKRHLKINPQASTYEELPLFAYADFEAMVNEDGTHLPILVCAQTSEDNIFHTFYGENCTEAFLKFLTQKTVDRYGEEREVLCLFHNLKGYDAMLLQN